ncbi:glycosyltransferase family 4 protein [Negadavirga shengliensis]|uniref:Glycosyltransferase family 4 protein n=1 Tax=Negadavirga shengliensis TaxID=1389218 RepID=A0ABV9SYR3_9BACT
MEPNTSPIRVLLMNSYSFEKIHDNWKKGINPSHYLMGKVELEKKGDFIIDIHQHQKFSWLNKLGRVFKIQLLDQQVRALFKLRKYDILYLPYPFANSRLITLLKWAKLIRIPIVILVHQNSLYGLKEDSLFKKISLKRMAQFDAFAFFSKALMERLKGEFGWSEEEYKRKFFHIHWGPDSEFYKKIKPAAPEGEKPFAVCAGTMDRDYNMLFDAFRDLNYDLKVFCTPTTIPQYTDIPSNISIDTSWVPYTQLLEAYKRASFIIIPLYESIKNKGHTYGLTVLLDAIAVGKPVIMTYHPYIDIDIERENIGVWVRKNDVEGWKVKLKELIAMEEEREQMGTNAKNLHLNKVNIDRFADEMEKIFKSVLAREGEV